MQVVEVGGQDALNILRDEWQTLQAQCPDATPFQTWEWNAAWWRHFGARKRPRLLLFRHAEEDGTPLLVGIAPLYTSRHLGTPLRRLAWVGTGHSDYLGPLARAEHQDAVACALRVYLDTRLRGWDIADLQQMRPDAPLLRQAAMQAADSDAPAPAKTDTSVGGKTTRRAPTGQAARQAAATQTVLPIEPCPYVTLPPTWDAFTARLGKKMRSNLGYYDRLLQKTFETVQFDTAQAETLDAGMTALFDLHQKRWNARWLPGVLGSARVQAFHRDIARQFLERDWLRLHLLTVDGTIRAVLYCFAYGGRAFYYLGGFTPDMGKYSLGTLLTGRAIRRAIEEGCVEFDFLRGDEPYKYKWQPDTRMNHRLLLIRSREGLGGLGELPGRAGFALSCVERYVTLRAKAFAEHQGRKTKTPGAVMPPPEPAPSAPGA